MVWNALFMKRLREHLYVQCDLRPLFGKTDNSLKLHETKWSTKDFRKQMSTKDCICEYPQWVKHKDKIILRIWGEIFEKLIQMQCKLKRCQEEPVFCDKTTVLKWETNLR